MRIRQHAVCQCKTPTLHRITREQEPDVCSFSTPCANAKRWFAVNYVRPGAGCVQFLRPYPPISPTANTVGSHQSATIDLATPPPKISLRGLESSRIDGRTSTSRYGHCSCPIG